MLQTGIAGLGDQLPGTLASSYERHRPEQTLLYQNVNTILLELARNTADSILVKRIRSDHRVLDSQDFNDVNYRLFEIGWIGWVRIHVEQPRLTPIEKPSGRLYRLG